VIDMTQTNRIHLLANAIRAALSRVAPDSRDAVAANLIELLLADEPDRREAAEVVLRALAEARTRDDVALVLVDLTSHDNHSVASAAEDALTTLAPVDLDVPLPGCPPLPALIVGANNMQANLSVAERAHVEICAHCRTVLALAAEDAPTPGTETKREAANLLAIGRQVLRPLADAFGGWTPSQLATGTVRSPGSVAAGPAGAAPGPGSGALEENKLERLGLEQEDEYRIQAGESGTITLVVDFQPLGLGTPTTATVQLVLVTSQEVLAQRELRGRGRVRRVVFDNLPIGDDVWSDISVEISGTQKVTNA
jgi:hypothetical protein